MSILLTHAYYLYGDDKERKIMKPYPPLGLLYISAYLKANNKGNEVYDSTFYSFEHQLEYILGNQPKIVAIYTNLMTKINVIKLVKILKTDKEYRNPTIILGGPDVTYNCRNYLKAGADFLIIGEGEETMLELSDAVLNKQDVSKINGIAYLENGEVKKTPSRIKIKDLEDLPLPNREAIDFQPYLETWKTYHNKSSMTVSTQRGCPYTCKWCSTAVYGQSYRRRPAKKVVEELLYLKNRYNPDSIWFVDDVFTISHKWIKQFREEMQKAGLKIPFECITRAERLNDEILKILKDIGCFRIWIGAESGSQRIIDAMDRRVEVEMVKKTIQKTNTLNIESGTFIMIGYPGETIEDINNTINYLKEANPGNFTITVAYPIRGTSLFNEIKDKITVNPDWETSTDRDIDFERTYPRKFYDYAIKHIINEVYYYKELQKKKIRWWLTSKHKLKSILAKAAMTIYRKEWI